MHTPTRLDCPHNEPAEKRPAGINRRAFLRASALAGGAAGLPLLGGAAAPAAGPVAAPQREEAWPAVDVLVCGGGPAGIAAAMMAAKLGRKTLLVEHFGRLGGMAVQAMVGPLMGDVRSAWVDGIVARLGGRNVDYEFADLKYAAMLEAAGAAFLLHARVAGPLLEGGRVAGVRLLTKRGYVRVPAHVTIDATGDGDLAFAAGAAFEQGRGAGSGWEADGLMQPMTIMFRVSGVDPATAPPSPHLHRHYVLPDGRTWNHLCAEANAAGELPPMVGFVRTYDSHRPDQRVINATHINYVDGTDARDLTRAELEGRRQVQPVLEFLRRHAPGFRAAYVSGMPAVVGVRETRRIRGVDHLELPDLLRGRTFPTAVVRGADFKVDIHNPGGIGQAKGVSDEHPLGKDDVVKPYDIPYGCLVPASIDGLLVAGRCISGSHEAMASYRVQVIAMATGIAAGTAAAQAAQAGIAPRAVDPAGIQEVVFAENTF
jgi:hypothetical protein